MAFNAMKRSFRNSAQASESWVRRGIVPNIPNALSLFRLSAAPVLLGLVLAGQDRAFRWLLVASLVSDIADGLIARRLQITSKLGALLDSTADLLVSVITVFAVFRLQPQFVFEHYGPVLLVVGLYLLAVAGAFLRYGKLASYHTIGSRIAAYAQGIFVVLLFFKGYEPSLFYLMIGITSVAYVEELVLLWLLPTWSVDVGGLYWVLKNERS